MPAERSYISQITLPNTNTYYIKDSEAREQIAQIIAGGLTFVVAYDGTGEPDVTKIPAGATVKYQGTTYTGTLAASAATKPNIYLVKSDVSATGRDIYEEYVTVNFGTTATPDYGWEVLGNTDISLDVLGDLAWKDSVALSKQTDVVLGESTTFTNSSSAVTFTGGSNDTFVKSYPGETKKLATTSITGVDGEVTFDVVKTSSTATATKVTFGTDTSATKVTVGTPGTANKTTLGTASTASKATAGTAFNVAKVASAATNVSYIGTASTDSVLESASVTGETLILGSVAVAQGSVTGTNGTESITPYTFADVTVYPDIAVSSDVSVPSFTTSDVTVPVISSHTDVTASVITTESKTAATKAANAITVATGSVATTDAHGGDVMVGLGTATTASAVTGIGTGTAAAQTITVGTNDKVTALTSNTDVVVS